jgi:diguanylate cyclase (GGDEF)-like protein
MAHDTASQDKAQEILRVAHHLQQAVFDALSSHIAVLDQQGHILQTNAAWQEFAQSQGFKPSSGVTGVRYFEVLEHLIGREHGVMLLTASQGIAAVIGGEMPHFQMEYSFQSAGEIRWFIIRALPVRDVLGRVVVSHEEVTRLKAAELANLMLANVDVLTNALSRRHFLDVAEQEFSRSQRYNMPLMVMMLDLDHFKQINDQHGHDAGDAVLRDFVHTVRGLLRDSDVIGRLGGEEFAVLLPSTKQEGGHALAERMVEQVSQRPVQVADQTLHYTVSIGVSSLSQEASFAALLKRADDALYRAKSSGRNGVHMDGVASPFE